jgi:transposase
VVHAAGDLGEAYLKVVREQLSNAKHILDRFHVVKLLNEAVDKVRRALYDKLQRLEG